MRTEVLIPDGVGIRNFLCAGLVGILAEHGDVDIWHALAKAQVGQYTERWGTSTSWHLLPQQREGLLERVLRQAKIEAQRVWCQEMPVRKVQRGHTRFMSSAIRLSAQFLGHTHASANGVARLDRLHATVASRPDRLGPYTEFLRAQHPDVVFCAHQRASVAVPALLAARRLGIPTATFIYSWDNLPKGRMAVHADYFLVWSEHMKRELLRYYPEVRTDRVYTVGTPQFEHYYNEGLVENREAFLTKLGLDPTRPVICFSGDDVTTSPHDPLYLRDLALAIESLPDRDRPQIVFRRCPVDRSSRYAEVLQSHPNIVVSEPLWESTSDEDWTQIAPGPADIALLANLVRHCDLVANVGSTMAVDFGILNKPAVFFAYDPQPATDEWRVADIYRLPHFKMVHELQPVYWATSADSLADVVHHALQNPMEKEAARREWIHRLVAQPMDRASERCALALADIAAKGRPQCT